MILMPEMCSAFDRYSANKIRDWMLMGFVGWVSGHTDSFYPHSFMNMYGQPAEGIEQIYSMRTVHNKTKRALRSAVVGLGALCQPGCPEYSDLDHNERLVLMKVFISLSEFMQCFESAELLVDIACNDSGYWAQHSREKEVFDSCIRCIGNIAINLPKNVLSEGEVACTLETCLIRLTTDPQFESRFSPFVFSALISITPKNLINHLMLLGAHIALLHTGNSEQRELAYLTANKIDLKTLATRFLELSFRAKDSRDRWLIDALFSEKGPLELTLTEDPTCPIITIKKDPLMQLYLRNNDWIHCASEYARPPYEETSVSGGNDEFSRYRKNIADFCVSIYPETRH